MQSYIRKNTWKSTENKGSNRILLLWTRVGILMSFLKHKLTCEVKSQSHLQPKWDCFKGRVWEQLRFPPLSWLASEASGQQLGPGCLDGAGRL